MQNMGITRGEREILLKAKNAKVSPKGKIQNEVPFWRPGAKSYMGYPISGFKADQLAIYRKLRNCRHFETSHCLKSNEVGGK